MFSQSCVRTISSQTQEAQYAPKTGNMKKIHQYIVKFVTYV